MIASKYWGLCQCGCDKPINPGVKFIIIDGVFFIKLHKRKEPTMAAKKKLPIKKSTTPKKKAVKKSMPKKKALPKKKKPEKKVEKSETKATRKSFSATVRALISDNSGMSNEDISKKIKPMFPNHKHTDPVDVQYYRKNMD